MYILVQILWSSWGFGVFLLILRATTTVKASPWRPASLLTHSLSWSVSLNPSGLHFGLFLWGLCYKMSRCAGSEDGRVHVWSTESGMKVAVLDGKHPGPINTLQFNPRYMTFASACTSMVRSKWLLHWSSTAAAVKTRMIRVQICNFSFSSQTFWLPCVDDL